MSNAIGKLRRLVNRDAVSNVLQRATMYVVPGDAGGRLTVEDQ